MSALTLDDILSDSDRQPAPQSSRLPVQRTLSLNDVLSPDELRAADPGYQQQQIDLTSGKAKVLDLPPQSPPPNFLAQMRANAAPQSGVIGGSPLDIPVDPNSSFLFPGQEPAAKPVMGKGPSAEDMEKMNSLQQLRVLADLRGQQNQTEGQQAALGQAAQQAEANNRQVIQQHPLAGRLANFSNAASNALGEGVAAVHGLVNPQAAHSEQQGLNVTTPVVAGPEATAGSAIGSTLPVLGTALIPGVGPVAAAAEMGAQGAGQARTDIASLREQGHNISGGQELAAAIGQGGVQTGLGLALGGAGKYLDGAFAALAPEAQAAVRAGDATVLQKLTAQALNAAGKSASGAAISEAVNTASNLIKRGYDPKTALSQGWAENGVLGALLPHVMPGEHGQTGDAPSTTPATPSLDSMMDVLPPQAQAEIAAMKARMDAVNVNEQMEHAKPPPSDEEMTQMGGRIEDMPKRRLADFSPDEQKQLTDLQARLDAVKLNETNNPMRRLSDISPEDSAMLEKNASFESPSDLLAKMRAKATGGPAESFPDSNARDIQSPADVRHRGMISIPESKFVENDVRPAIKSAGDTITKLWKATNLRLGTGLGLSDAEKRTSLDIRQALGEHERQISNIEHALKPAREAMKNVTTDSGAGAQWIDHAEATGQSMHPDPSTQSALDLNAKLNAENADAAKKVGINVGNWNGDYIGRLFVPDEANPNRPSPNPGGKSLQGSGGFLHGRDYKNYSDALAAAKASGLKPLYENPMDMLLAKQAEVRRFITTKQLLHQQENAKALNWVPDGEKPPEGLQRLQDRSATSERDLIAPKWMAAKLAKLNTYDGDRYIQEQQDRGNIKPLRADQDVPNNMAKIGRTQRGSYYGSAATAGLFDSMINTLPADSPVKTMSTVARTIAGLQYAMGTAHTGLVFMGNIAGMTGEAIENAMHGEWTPAMKNLLRAMDVAGIYGKKVREQMVNPGAFPELEDVAKRVAASNPSLAKPSVLEAKRTWKDVGDAWDSGNRIGAIARAAAWTAGLVHEHMNDLVKNTKAQVQGAQAETAIRRGQGMQESRAVQAQSQSVTDSTFGFAASKTRFQNEMYKAVRDLLFSAGQYAEGPVRVAAGTVDGSLRALADGVQGKPMKMTPAMKMVLGGVASTVAMNSMLQLITTTLTTGHPIMPTGRDFVSFRTGKKDANGHDERVTLPGIASNLAELITQPAKFAYNRLNPLIRGGYESYENRDFRNQPIYDPNAPEGEKAFASAKHITEGVLPRAIGGGTGGNLAEKVISRQFGTKFSHSMTPAEETLHSLEDSRSDLTPEDAKRESMIADLANRMRNREQGIYKPIRDAIKDGTLRPGDMDLIEKRASEPGGFIGSLQRSDLDPTSLMKVWRAMDQDQRAAAKWIVRRKVVGSKEITPELRRQFLGEITADLQTSK